VRPPAVSFSLLDEEETTQTPPTTGGDARTDGRADGLRNDLIMTKSLSGITRFPEGSYPIGDITSILILIILILITTTRIMIMIIMSSRVLSKAVMNCDFEL
jgi:hypothetical protein